MESKTSYDSSISTVKVEVCFIIETMHEIEQSQSYNCVKNVFSLCYLSYISNTDRKAYHITAGNLIYTS